MHIMQFSNRFTLHSSGDLIISLYNYNIHTTFFEHDYMWDDKEYHEIITLQASLYPSGSMAWVGNPGGCLTIIL